MPWGGRRRIALGKSRLSHLRRNDDELHEEGNSKGSDANPLAGMLGGYEDDEEEGDQDKKFLESSEEEEEESESPDEPSPKPPDEENCPWAATVDQNTGKEYYWNKETGKTSWEKPTELIDLDHLKIQYKRMKELVGKRRAEKKARREAAKRARDERRMVRAKLRAKMEAERIAKEEEEKKRAEEMKSQFANFMNMIEDLTEEQKKKKADDEAKQKKEEEKAAAEQEKRRKEVERAGEGGEKSKAELKRFLKKKTKWRAVTDKTTGKTYFWNKETMTTTWTKPEELIAAEKEAENALANTSGRQEGRKGGKMEEGSSKKRSTSRSPSEGRNRRRRHSSRSKSLDHEKRQKGKASSSEGPGAENGDRDLVVNALAAGIRCSVKEAWPDAPEGLEIPPLTRVRVELDIRMQDWKEGSVGTSETEQRLRELALKIKRIIEHSQDSKLKVENPAGQETGELKDSKDLEKSTNDSKQNLTSEGPRSNANAAPSSPKTREKYLTKIRAAKMEKISEDKDSDDMEWDVAQNAVSDCQSEPEDSDKLRGKNAGLKRKRKSSKPVKMKNKKMEGLVNKWAKVQRETQKEGPELDTYERRRHAEAKEVEQWKKRQVETGAAVSNENFIPIENWRERLVSKKRGADTLDDEW